MQKQPSETETGNNVSEILYNFLFSKVIFKIIKFQKVSDGCSSQVQFFVGKTKCDIFDINIDML